MSESITLTGKLAVVLANGTLTDITDTPEAIELGLDPNGDRIYKYTVTNPAEPGVSHFESQPPSIDIFIDQLYSYLVTPVRS